MLNNGVCELGGAFRFQACIMRVTVARTAEEMGRLAAADAAEHIRASLARRDEITHAGSPYPTIERNGPACFPDMISRQD